MDEPKKKIKKKKNKRNQKLLDKFVNQVIMNRLKPMKILLLI